MSSSITSFFACFALLAGLAPDAFAERNFSAPAPIASKAAPVREALTGVAPAARLALEPLAASRVGAIREKNARVHAAALQVGVVRDLEPSAQSRSRMLAWSEVAGGHALQWRVHVAGSHALRVGIEVRNAPAGVVARFAAAAPGATVLREALPRSGLFWGPLLPGEDAVVELFAPAAIATHDIDVAIARVADHFASPLRGDPLAKSEWLAAPCEVDLVCESRSDPALERAGAASIKINWIEGYSAYACSATLLNPADGSFRPYVYTAAHCVNDAAAAASLVSIWFYEKSTCGGEDARAAVQVGGGAQLLVSDDAYDASLLRLNRMPPAGAVYAGWDSAPASAGEAMTALHHANGEVTKVSHGTVVARPPDPLFAIAWSSGIVQGGSSGSGAFSRVEAPQPDLLMRGGLSATNATCSAPGYGLYSRLDTVWPLVAPYLSASAEHANATGLWWNAAEPGWGVSVSQQGDVAFAVLFTYADDGRPAWLVASSMREESVGVFSGALYRAAKRGVTPVGRMRLALATAGEATLEYSVDGRAVTQSITRQAFNGFPPVCTAAAPSRATAATYQDLWWDATDPGWGLGLAQQGDVIFATLFTYDDGGRDTWLVASSVTRDAGGEFSGVLYRTSLAATDGGAKRVKATGAGSLRLAFLDGGTADATLVVDGHSVVKRITRQVFGPSPTACR